MPKSTILRSSWFFQNFTEGQFSHYVASGELALPVGSVGEPFIDTDDIADVAVECLLDDRHAGRTYELTGPELLSFAQLAEIVTRCAPDPLAFRAVSMDDFVTGLEAAGVEADVQEALAFLFSEVLDGRSESTTTDVETVLARPATRFETFVKAQVAAGLWPARM